MAHTWQAGRMPAFRQVDVFTRIPLRGNPLAVIHDADDWSTEQMARFANWTNLSETTFLLNPTEPAADYRVRIFTTAGELPSPGTRRLGPRTPGWRRAAYPRPRGKWCSSAGSA